MMAQGQALIAAGYPLVINFPPNHCVSAWGYDSYGWMGLDGRSPSTTPYHLDYASAYAAAVTGAPTLVIKTVAFTTGVTPPPPPPPPSFTITQAQLDLLNSTWKGVTVPTITQAQIDTVQGVLNAITGAAPPPPPGVSPDKTMVPPSASITDNGGSVWKLSGTIPLCNNEQYGQTINAVLLLEWSGGMVYAKTNTGQWLVARGSWWNSSAGP